MVITIQQARPIPPTSAPSTVSGCSGMSISSDTMSTSISVRRLIQAPRDTIVRASSLGKLIEIPTKISPARTAAAPPAVTKKLSHTLINGFLLSSLAYSCHQLIKGPLLGLAQAATENGQQVQPDIGVAAQ